MNVKKDIPDEQNLRFSNDQNNSTPFGGDTRSIHFHFAEGESESSGNHKSKGFDIEIPFAPLENGANFKVMFDQSHKSLFSNEKKTEVINFLKDYEYCDKLSFLHYDQNSWIPSLTCLDKIDTNKIDSLIRKIENNEEIKTALEPVKNQFSNRLIILLFAIALLSLYSKKYDDQVANDATAKSTVAKNERNQLKATRAISGSTFYMD